MSCNIDFSHLPYNTRGSTLILELPSSLETLETCVDPSGRSAHSAHSSYKSPAFASPAKHHNPHLCWYVVLLLDINKQGHTQVIKTTDIEAWLTASGASSEPVDADPGELSTAGWRTAVIIEVGTDEALASRIINLISTNSKGKQVRGAAQRGARADLLATLMQREFTVVWPAVLNITEEQARYLHVHRYRL